MNGLERRVRRVGRNGRRFNGAGGARRLCRRLRPASVLFESLEDRCLLASLAIAAVGDGLTYTANSGSTSALTIKLDPSNPSNVIFTDSAQTITLSGTGTTSWTGGSTNTVEGPLSSFSSVLVTGSSPTLDQSLTIDYSNGDPLHSGGLTFTPQNLTGAANALTLTSGASGVAFLSETYAPSGPGAGTITYSDSTNSSVPIAFSNLSAPITDVVASSSYFFTSPSTVTTVNVVDAATPGQTEINAGTTGTFETVDFAGKTAVTVNANVAGATTTVNVTSPSSAMAELFVDSGAGNETIDVQATPRNVTTTTDTGSPSGSTTSIGLDGKLSSILGPLVVQSTGASTNMLSVDDSAQTAPTSYTISNSTLTATSFPTTISLGAGFGTLNLKSSGGSTVNLEQLSQSGIGTFNFTGGAPLGDNTLKVTSNVATLDYGTAGALTFGAGEPTINYSVFPTVNVTKLATAPVGTGTTINAKVGQSLNNVVVANFTESDLTNRNANFVASIDWGDGTTTGGTITPIGTTGFQVAGSHIYTASGPFTVNVTLTDQSTSGTTTVGGTTINVTSNGPVVSTPSPIVSTANVSSGLLPNSVYNFNGVTLKGVVQDVETTQDVAVFQSSDPNATATDFTATINWGDGTTTAGSITEDASAVFHISGTHSYAKAGSFTPTVTLRDINGQSYATGSFYQTNWVSSIPGNAPEIDSSLINPWGMSSSSASPIWVSDQGAGVSTLYNPNANPIKLGLTVTVPPSGTPSGPTGQLFNNDPNSADFVVPDSSPAVPARFLFATLAGTVDAWASGSTAAVAATVSGAVFTGLAQGSVTSGTTTTYYLYAADFTGATGTNGIDVFDSTFTNVSSTTFAGKFADPNAISGYEPYNIAQFGGDLYVTYARPNGIVTSPGGYIDEFATDGTFVKRVYTDTAGTTLAGPWGMAIAPSGFGSFGGDLLVGNLGDGTGTSPSGTIAAINLTNGTLAGTISGANGHPIVNPGQWGLLFGNGGAGGTSGTLYFSAGSNGQTAGLFGSIASAAQATFTVAAAPLTAMGATVNGIEGNALSTAASGVLIATFQDSGTPGSASSYTATINWGDGATSSPIAITSQGTPNGVVYSVFGDHTYAEIGTYPITVTITNGANGAMVIASSQAVIADAALAPSATQPTVSTTEAIAFSGAVASFTDGNPTAPLTDYNYVMINWGDGTPATAGMISQPGGVGTAFVVSGTHTYADAGVQGGIGHYPITVNLHDVDGSTLAISNTANVADVVLTVSGKLNPASDSGISNMDNITNVVQPNFIGSTNQPDATITLYATMAGSSTAVPIGTGTSDASGAWSITADQALANGAYYISAVAVDADGHTVSANTAIVPDLVIDTVGPKVTSVHFNRFQGQIVVTFQDYGGLNNTGAGLAQSSLIDANNYQLVTIHHPRVGKYRMNVISDVPGTTSGTQTVTLTINKGHYIKGGWYRFTIFSASPTNTSGVRDVAGNALDGEFYGYFPSGNNVNGGNFVAQLTAIHHTIFAPSTLVGRGTPVNPPGMRQGNVRVPGTFNPSKLPRVSAVSTPNSRHTAARVHHNDPARSHPILHVGAARLATPKADSASVTRMGVIDQAIAHFADRKSRTH